MLAKKHYGIKQQHCGSLRKLAAPRQPARNNLTFHGAATQRLGLEDSASFPQWVSGQAGTAILRSVACSASDASAANAAPAVDPGMLIIHYVRKDHNYKVSELNFACIPAASRGTGRGVLGFRYRLPPPPGPAWHSAMSGVACTCMDRVRGIMRRSLCASFFLRL